MSIPAPDQAILSAFWRVLAGSGWHGLTLRAVAAEAGLPLADLRRHFTCPLEILGAHQRAVDAGVLEGTVEDMSSTARDRLFDVLMRRLDALQPDRPGVVRLLHDLPRAPLLALWFARRNLSAMAWMLEAAGLDAAGPAGLARAQGLGAVWLAALRAWEKDESEDLSATMAALDRALDQADRVARWLRWAPVEASASDAPMEAGPDAEPATEVN
ncbi:TetR family transcriptional regulator [Sediminicoccus sp. KRV36]|uniref:TetR family transcriptional regulator n=1 Tax=Sediminicoccus sp. KRV36 TaxID=3133721 RepID=UPI00200F88D9|nr:TetR family transcriptional regulator [Sediminicoccus rosea]UPY37415.1 TetR family transcriptional regulator [Sediminicoccus rosea]